MKGSVNRTWARKTMGMLVFLLFALSSACGAPTTTPQAGGPTSTAGGTVSAGNSTTPAATEAGRETITLKLWGVGTNGAVTSPGVQTDPIAQAIEKKFGIKVEFYPQETDQVFTTMLAGGDLPDIMVVNRRFAKQMIDGNAVLDMEPLLGQYGANITKHDLTINYDKRFMSAGQNKVYFLTLKPNAKDTPSLTVAPWLRWDYYKELGYPAINSIDDYLNVLAQMVKKHPTNEDGKKVYGLSPWFDWGMWSYTTPAYIQGIWQFGMLDYNMGNNMAVASTITDPNSSYWWTARLYNKANRLGLLDPDSFTQKFDTAVQKATAHRVVGSLVSFQLTEGNRAFYSAGKQDQGYQPIPPLEGTAAYWGGYVQPLGVDGHIAISSKTKYPERAMELVNYLFSEEGSRLAWSGAAGSTYDDMGGKLTVKSEVLEQRKSDPDFAVKTGVGRYGSFAGLPPSDKDANGQFLNLFQEPDVLALDSTPLDRAYFEHYGVKSYDELINQRVKTALVDTSVILLSDQTPDDIKRTDDKIVNYLTTNGPKLILAKSDEEFTQLQQQMINDIKGMGFDTSFAYWSKVAEDAKSAMAEINK